MKLNYSIAPEITKIPNKKHSNDSFTNFPFNNHHHNVLISLYLI